MAKKTSDNIRLGVFVASGLVLLIISLYIIGKNHSMFGSNFAIKARFRNVNGLQQGNNVRFAGIQAGTVNKIEILSDTAVEVTILLDKKIKPYVRKNAIATIGNEGLMGNKVINIYPASTPAPEVEEGNVLNTRQIYSTEELMQVLTNTNNNIEVISEELKTTVKRINASKSLWGTLNDSTLAPNLSASIANVKTISEEVNNMTVSLNTIIHDVQHGKGTVGSLLTDEKMASDLKQAMSRINEASDEAKNLVSSVDSLVKNIHSNVNEGPGTIHDVLKDPQMAERLQNSIANIEKGTAAFNEDMEALKHNFLTRGYFRKQEKKNKQKKK